MYCLVFTRPSSLLLDVKREGLGLSHSFVLWRLDHRPRFQVLEPAGGGATVLAESCPPCAEERYSPSTLGLLCWRKRVLPVLPLWGVLPATELMSKRRAVEDATTPVSVDLLLHYWSSSVSYWFWSVLVVDVNLGYWCFVQLLGLLSFVLFPIAAVLSHFV